MIGEQLLAIRTSTILYDVSRTSYVESRDILPWFLMIVLGILLLPRSDDRRYRIGSIFLIGGGLAFLLITAGVDIIQHRTLVERLQHGQYERVQGAITNFVPGSFDGHTQESFTVAGRTYTFSARASIAGYHDVQGPQGPLREGTEVRIADVDGTIARFELVR